MSEPTIDEAIEYLINLREVHGGTILGRGSLSLAIRALKEMREREITGKICPGPDGRKWGDVSAKEMFDRCLREDDRSKIAHIAGICVQYPHPPKPRTWRDVTAGEMVDAVPLKNTTLREVITESAEFMLEKQEIHPDLRTWDKVTLREVVDFMDCLPGIMWHSKTGWRNDTLVSLGESVLGKKEPDPLSTWRSLT